MADEQRSITLKEVFFRWQKDRSIADLQDELIELQNNYAKKRQLLNDLRDDAISEEVFREKFAPLLELDDVILALEQKIIARFPEHKMRLQWDVDSLRASIQLQNDLLNKPVLRQDRLRSAVLVQLNCLVAEEHEVSDIEREAQKAIPPKPVISTEMLIRGWQYPKDFFVEDPWLRPQAALEFFKDVIWNVYRVITQKESPDMIKGVVQAWARQHLVAPFPNADLYADTILQLSSVSVKKTRALSDVISNMKDLPDPVDLKEPSTKRIVFAERWQNVRSDIKKLPGELQVFLKHPADILDAFAEFLFTVKGDMEPMMVRPPEISESATPSSLWTPPDEWFPVVPGSMLMRSRSVATRAAFFIFTVADGVVRMIDDPDSMAVVIDELGSNQLAIPNPGLLGTALSRIAGDQKSNVKAWRELAALARVLHVSFDRVNLPAGWLTKRKLEKLKAKVDDAGSKLPSDVHDFLSEPFLAIDRFFDAATGVVRKVA